MNIKHIAATASLLIAAGFASAAPNELNFPSAQAVKSTSSVTREQVKAETVAARAAGQLDVSEARPFNQSATLPSTVTRDEVRAQTLAARDAGLLDTNEAYASPAYNQRALRPNVSATLQASAKAGKTQQ